MRLQKMTDTFSRYFPVVVLLVLILLAFKYGNWKQRSRYYPTILFAICVDFFISLLLYSHPLWRFYPAFMIPNHSFSDFFIALTNVPLIVLVYLSRYPFHLRLKGKLLYVMAWTLSFSMLESIFFHLKLITYHNGWNFPWSIVVWLFTFLGLVIHYKKPILAWILCICCTIFLILYFHIPVAELK
jgi:hypothetical protein